MIVKIMTSILNYNVPICSTCKFYKRQKCTKFGKKDVVTGKVKFSDAYDCRKSNDKCGQHGTFYMYEKNHTFRNAFDDFTYYSPYVGVGLLWTCLSVVTKYSNIK